ncbi:hypothetical protein [Mycobacterium sp. URHB0044]|uniref:hypothetical protein n=1 Tax=Mycobacterium sp. URHB0044 TaxID=1380386 RepID=UPI00048ED683|nr:hypothetical protein [Mycobacterium sp. URHB0044]
MGAPLEICRKRTAVAVLASGVVISLTAMTGGIAPAFAAPKNDPATPTTTVVVPEPEQQAPQEEAPKETKAPEKAPEPPAVVEAPPQTKAPEKAPEPPEVVEAPPQTQAPQTQAPQTQAPQTQAPQIQAPQTQAPVTRAPETQSSTAKPTTAASSTAAPAPAPTAEASTPRTAHPSTDEQAPATSAEKSAAPAPSSETTTATGVSPSTALVAPTDASQAPAKSGEPSTETSGSPSPATESEPTSASGSSRAGQTASSSVSQAAKEIETVEPQTLKAPEQDVVLAKSAKPVEELLPAPAPKQDVAEFARAIDLPDFDRDFRDGNASRKDRDFKDRDFRPDGDRDWNRHVRQWDPDWVQYDDYYRPVISNPYRNTVKIIYVYQNAPRIVYIPPLARIVLEVAQFAAYSFTAIVDTAINTAVNTAVNVAVGSFFGGGYFPGIGLPLPPPPPPVWRYDNVPVQVRYSNNNVYEPFRVQRIVDVGNDSQYGERKVLLDGVTPAWGEWTQNAAGERQFEIHKTQQFPGLDEPREGPLPGDYQLRLASDQSASDGFTSRDVYLMASAGVLGLLSLGAVLWAVMLGRRRTQH